MKLDALRFFLSEEPVHPFDLKLANGDAHRIRQRDQVAVGKNMVAVVYSDSDRMAHRTLHQIVSVEREQPESPKTESRSQATDN